jgi:FkbM family methyltransferase
VDGDVLIHYFTMLTANVCLFCLVVSSLLFGFIHPTPTSQPCHFLAKTERSFNALTHSLFSDGYIPLGDVLDVGAHDGSWSCMYACFDLNRTVHAVDPSAKMLKAMHCPHPNMIKHHYAISNVTGWMKWSDHAAQFMGKLEVQKQGEVEIQTLDNLFLTQWNTKPGFLHIDVEGYELDVLLGANQTINLHQPVFSVEIHVQEDKEFTVRLLHHIESLQYTIYMVNEICGLRLDCRNFLCFPNNHFQNHALIYSHAHNKRIMRPTLDVALRHSALVKVHSQNIFRKFETYEKSAIAWQETDTFSDNAIADRL